jgi:hypothetical protein
MAEIKFLDLEKVMGRAYMALFPDCDRLQLPNLFEQAANVASLCDAKKKTMAEAKGDPLDSIVWADCKAWLALYWARGKTQA